LKLDKWDALFGFLIAFVNSGAKVLTGIALSIGFREANPFMKSPTNVLSGLALIVLIIFALFFAGSLSQVRTFNALRCCEC